MAIEHTMSHIREYLDSLGTMLATMGVLGTVGRIVFRRQNARIKVMEENMLPRKEAEQFALRISSEFKAHLGEYYKTRDEVNEDIKHHVGPIKEDINELKRDVKKLIDYLIDHKS